MIEPEAASSSIDGFNVMNSIHERKLWLVKGVSGRGDKKSAGITGNQRGVSVLAVIFAIIVLAAVGYAFGAMMAAKQKSVPATLDAGRAFYLAEGGTHYAAEYLSAAADWSALDDTTPAELNGVTLGGGSFTVSLSDYSGGSPESIKATCTGTYDSGQRVVKATFQR